MEEGGVNNQTSLQLIAAATYWPCSFMRGSFGAQIIWPLPASGRGGDAAPSGGVQVPQGCVHKWGENGAGGGWMIMDHYLPRLPLLFCVSLSLFSLSPSLPLSLSLSAPPSGLLLPELSAGCTSGGPGASACLSCCCPSCLICYIPIAA